jgi:Flp pilus assembly protein TadG
MRRAERGQNILETAILLVPLLLLLFGALDVGRAFNHYIIITNAAREGARLAARLPCFAGDAAQRQNLKTNIVNAVIQEAANQGITLVAGDVTITPDPVKDGCYPSTSAGSPIFVGVTYQFATYMGDVLFMPTLKLQSKTQMPWFGNDTG